ncbi:MAG: DUF2169 domain-containing protein [Byssovorax sp.]
MEITSYCPLRVASVTWRHRAAAAGEDAWSITLVVKATYALRPGHSPLASEQESPHERDEHWSHSERKSLRIASDLAPFKGRAEVLVHGTAYAPAKRPVDELAVRVAVGEVDKTIAIVGDRAFGPDGAITGFAPFVRMPLTWERAAGGLGTSNPVGVRLDGADAYGITPLPNLRAEGARLLKRGDFIAPIGFAPMAPSWPLRAGALGDLVRGWDHRRWNERPLPVDFDAGYFNAAPLDQHQDEPFRGDEEILLENLHPEIPLLVTRLDPIQPLAGISRGGAAREEIPLRCDTLVIDADRSICTLIWRAQVRLWHPQEAGDIAVWMEKKAARAPVIFDEVTFSGHDESVPEAALPFSATAAPSAARHERASEAPRPHSSGATAGSSIVDEPTAPMESERDPLENEPATAPRAPIMALGRGVRLATPPSSPPPAPAPPALLSVVSSPDEQRTPPLAAISFPFDVPPPALLSVHAPMPEIDAQIQAPTPPAPPPLLGPLAGLVAPTPSAPTPAAALEEPAVEAPAPPPAPAATVAITVEQFATITAEMFEERSPRAAILDAHGLTEHDWSEAAAGWSSRLDKESARGGSKLRAPHDLAYLAAVEGFRGPITLAEFGRVVVGLERGGAETVLADLAIQGPAMMPLLRVWTKKVATDPRLADESATLLATLRDRDDDE